MLYRIVVLSKKGKTLYKGRHRYSGYLHPTYAFSREHAEELISNQTGWRKRDIQIYGKRSTSQGVFILSGLS
jgi:hypothetical protein